jgi:hypothetical protein
MRLTTDYTEIVVDSSRVPGYWAKRANDGKKIFLYTRDQSYKTGDVLKVEGAMGPAPAAVFDDETGIYECLPSVHVFIVWKALLSSSGRDTHAAVPRSPGK